MKKHVRSSLSMISYEWLKLRKQKMTYVYLFLLLLMPMIAVKMAYDDTVFTIDPQFTNSSSEVVNLDTNEILTGFPAMNYVDEQLHAKQGIREYYVSKYNDFHIVTRQKFELQYTSKENIDEVAMSHQYGSDWETLVEQFKNGSLNLFELVIAEGGDTSDYIDSTEDDVATYMEIHFTDIINATIETQTLLANADTVPPIEKRKETHLSLENQKLWAQPTEDRFLPNAKNIELNEIYKNNIQPFLIIKNIDQPMIDFLNDQYLNASETFDSQIGVNFLVNTMDKMSLLSPFIFFLFALLFAPLFNQEYTVKTDQILKPTKLGLKKQANAKIALCVGSMFFYALLSLLIFWLIPFFMIGFHDFDIVYRSQDIFTTVPNNFHVSVFVYTTTMSSLYLLSYLTLGTIISGLSATSRNSFTFLIKFMLVLVILTLGLSAPLSIDLAGLINFSSPLSFYNSEFTFQVYKVYNYSYHSFAGFILSNQALMWMVYGFICSSVLFLSKRFYHKRTIKNA